MIEEKLIITIIIKVRRSITKVQGNVFVGSDKSECREFGIDIGRIDCDMRVMTPVPVGI
jgi:hypothetical protein